MDTNEQGLVSLLVSLFKSEAFLTLINMVALVVIVWLYKRQPFIAKYKGFFIESVKLAERLIPDNTENKSARRLDTALRHLESLLTQADIRFNEQELKNGLNQVHAELEANENI